MVRSKECFKCKAVKPINEFYKHSEMADGHLNKCIECTKLDVKSHREKNIDRIREYDRQRSKTDSRIRAAIEVNRRWREEDSRRTKAHNAVARAIKSGALIKIPCTRCGSEKSLAHHEDYDKPLDVVWLCQPCHKKRHAEINMKNKKI